MNELLSVCNVHTCVCVHVCVCVRVCVCVCVCLSVLPILTDGEKAWLHNYISHWCSTAHTGASIDAQYPLPIQQVLMSVSDVSVTPCSDESLFLHLVPSCGQYFLFACCLCM